MGGMFFGFAIIIRAQVITYFNVYFFDNGSSVPTLYQEKPLNFNLGFGLRLNLK